MVRCHTTCRKLAHYIASNMALYISNEKENDPSMSMSTSMRRSQLPLRRASANKSLSSTPAPQKLALVSTAAAYLLASSSSCSRSSSSGPQCPPVFPSSSGHRADSRNSSSSRENVCVFVADRVGGGGHGGGRKNRKKICKC